MQAVLSLMLSTVQLPRAPEAIHEENERLRLAAEAASIAAYEADVAVLRELRMALRDVTTKLLIERRWRAFAEPVTPEDDPEFWHRVRCWEICSLATETNKRVCRSTAQQTYLYLAMVLCQPRCSACLQLNVDSRYQTNSDNP